MLITFDSSIPAGYEIIGSMGVPNIGFGGLEFDSEGNLRAYACFYKSTGGAAAGLYRVDINAGPGNAGRLEHAAAGKTSRSTRSITRCTASARRPT